MIYFYHTKSSCFLKIVATLCMCFLLYAPIIGQPSKKLRREIDSLRTLYLYQENDSISLKALTRLGQRMRRIDVDSSKAYLREAIANYKLRKIDLESLAFAYNVIGDIYKIEPNVDSASYYYEEAYLFFSTEKAVKPLLAIIPPFGNFLAANNEVKRGVNMLQEGIALAKERKDYANLSFLYEYLGEVFQTVLKDNNRAIDYYTKGIEASERIKIEDELNYNRINASLSLNLSSIYLEEKKIANALEYAEKAVDFGTKGGMFQLLVGAYNNLCEGQIALKQYNKARAYNKQATTLNRKIKNIYANIQSQILNQSISLNTGAYSDCIAKGENILSKFEQHLGSDKKAKIFEQLCECNGFSGNMQDALKAKDSLLHYTRKILNIEQNELLARLDREYQVKEKEAENNLLLAKQEASLKELKAQRFAALGLGGAFLFAVAWAVAFYRASRQKEKYNEVLEQRVTERTKELQHVNVNLEQANKELRTFNFIASHDIKGPIQNIGNFVRIIRGKLPDNLKGEFSFLFDTIQKNTVQLSNLVEDFSNYISFSKNEVIPKEKVNLNELIEELSSSLTVIGKYKNGKVINHGLPDILSNKSILYIILKNLIENGLKYNDREAPTVHVSYQETATFHQIQIKDNGIGIKKEYFNKIFEMFKRLHDKQGYDGTGIGLALVDLLIKKLNGKVELVSNVGEGSVFTLYFQK